MPAGAGYHNSRGCLEGGRTLLAVHTYRTKGLHPHFLLSVGRYNVFMQVDSPADLAGLIQQSTPSTRRCAGFIVSES